MARIFDCFTFFNELDLLEIRLNELATVVDRFVIAEATHSYSGEPKPLHYLENRSRFAAFADRIVHVRVDDMPLAAPSGWARQDHQRDALKGGLADAAPDDLIMLSDVDEIVRGESLKEAAQRSPEQNEVLCFELRMFRYFVNCESDLAWLRTGPRGVRRRILPQPSALRAVRGPAASLAGDLPRALKAWRILGRPVRRRLVRDAGWHFSYLGGPEALTEKMRAFIGSEKVRPELLGAEAWAARIPAEIAGKDTDEHLVMRTIDNSFPAYLRANRKRFAHLIADPAELAKPAAGGTV